MKVNEIFLSIQGEGEVVGLLSNFVRLAGCNLRCSWCIAEGTKILDANLQWKNIEDVHIGERIVGTKYIGGQRKLCLTTVIGKRESTKEVYRLVTDRGYLDATTDHKILETTYREYFKPLSSFRPDDELLFVFGPTEHKSDESYMKGWITGYITGDGSLTGQTRANGRFQHKMYVASKRLETISRLNDYLKYFGVNGTLGYHYAKATLYRLYITAQEQYKKLESIMFDSEEDTNFMRGFLGGFYDAEGSFSDDLRFVQKDDDITQKVAEYIRQIGFEPIVATYRLNQIRIAGGYAQQLKFLSTIQPVRTNFPYKRPREFAYTKEVYPIGRKRVFDISTDCGSFIANGFIVHNCDTTYAFEEYEELSVMDVIKKLKRAAPLITITGGEPLLQQSEVYELCYRTYRFWDIVIETNGTILPEPPFFELPIIWAVSPKLSNSGNVSELRFPPKYASYFKFVITKEDDLWEMFQYADDYRIPNNKLIVQPSDPSLVRQLADWIVDHCLSVRLVPQIHKFIWCGQRGK